MVIFCIGLPRSGSTLQYNIVKSVLFESGLDYVEHGFFESGTFLGEQKGKINLIKTHRFNDAMNNSNAINFISYRDFIDAYESAKIKNGISEGDFYTKNMELLSDFDRITNKSSVVWQSYEQDLYEQNNISAIREIAKCLQVNLSKAQIAQISNKCCIEATKGNLTITLGQKIKKGINSLVLRLPDPIKKILKSTKLNVVLRYFVPHNIESKNSLLHVDHISKTNGQPGQRKYPFTKMELDMLTVLKTKFSEELKLRISK
jgi:hypothetical protein